MRTAWLGEYGVLIGIAWAHNGDVNAKTATVVAEGASGDPSDNARAFLQLVGENLGNAPLIKTVHADVPVNMDGASITVGEVQDVRPGAPVTVKCEVRRC